MDIEPENLYTWSQVKEAVELAIKECCYATGMHTQIHKYVSALQITHDALGTDGLEMNVNIGEAK